MDWRKPLPGRNSPMRICVPPMASPWTGDITDTWDGRKDYSLGVVTILDLMADLAPYAGPGHWNDPDMLEVGNGGMTDTEYRSHFSLWAILAAPLIAGNDVATMNPATRTIL